MQINYLKLRRTIDLRDKSLISGYLRQIVNVGLSSITDLILYSIFAFFYIDCDIFTSFYWEYSLSADKKTLNGLGYGDICINPHNNKCHNHYEWLIKINYLYDDSKLILGITSKKTTNKCWWYDNKYLHYNFVANNDSRRHQEYIDDNLYKLVPFKTGDIVLLILNLRLRFFSILINGKLHAMFVNINVSKGMSYYLAAHVLEESDYISLIGYTQFNDNNNDKTLTQYKLSEIPSIIHHPNDNIDFGENFNRKPSRHSLTDYEPNDIPRRGSCFKGIDGGLYYVDTDDLPGEGPKKLSNRYYSFSEKKKLFK